MGKAIRKCLPSPPKWFWWIEDCFMCPRRKCGNCKSMKSYLSYLEHVDRKKTKQKLREENK